MSVARFDAGHNYNQQSREAVYGWIARWLLDRQPAGPVHEASFTPESEAVLSCYDAAHPRPADELGVAGLKESLARIVTAQAEALAPRSAAQWRRGRRILQAGIRHRLAVETPAVKELLVETGREGRMFVGRRGAGDRVPARLWPAGSTRAHAATLVVSPGVLGSAAAGLPLVQRLRDASQTVLAIDVLGVGEHGPAPVRGEGFFTTYNRTLLVAQVQDVLTALAFLRAQPGVHRVNLAGGGRLGPVCLLARALDPAVARTAVDADAFEYAPDGNPSAAGRAGALERARAHEALVEQPAPGDRLFYTRRYPGVGTPTGPHWKEIGFMAIGGALTLALAKLSYTVPAFPFHPIGYVLAICFAVEYNWPAFLAIWIVKGLILRYGGRGLYVRLVPFFLGLVLGGLVAPVCWGFLAWLFEWYK